MIKHSTFFLFGFLIIALFSCNKETRLIPDNDAPDYSGISTIKIENYVNRLFIDLIGREPTQVEMNQQVSFLKGNDLKKEARIQLVERLMNSNDFVENDSSYSIAYSKRLYELYKARFLEGASNQTINEFIGIAEQDYLSDSLNGDLSAMEISRERFTQLKKVLLIPQFIQSNQLLFTDFYQWMLLNDVYDFINMNSFNYVRSCFNDLFDRFPTNSEFQVGFDMVENNVSGSLFNQIGSTKADFTLILVQSNECYEGSIRWMYRTLLAREATSVEVQTTMVNFMANKDMRWLQTQILITDEYASFL